MLSCLKQFLSALYSPIFYNIFNRTDIRLDSPERKMTPEIVSKMYIKLYLTSRWCPPKVNHSLDNSLKNVNPYITQSPLVGMVHAYIVLFTKVKHTLKTCSAYMKCLNALSLKVTRDTQ